LPAPAARGSRSTHAAPRTGAFRCPRRFRRGLQSAAPRLPARPRWHRRCTPYVQNEG